MKTIQALLTIFLGALALSASATADDGVAVLTFSSKGTTDELAERVRGVIADSLTSGGFEVIDPAELDEAIKGIVVGDTKVDSAVASRIRAKTQCKWVVTGRIFKSGETTFLLAKIIDATSDYIDAGTQQFSKASDMEKAIADLSADVISKLSSGGK